MPAKSKAQRRLIAIAEHHPGEVYAKNKGVLKMSHEQLHDFAAVKEKGLPASKGKPHVDRGHRNVQNKRTHAAKLRHG